MNNTIKNPPLSAVAVRDEGLTKSMVKFNQLLDKPPKPEWIKVNPYSNNSKYIPIRIVESLLRTFYVAHQIEQTFEPRVIGNSVVCCVRVRVMHPVLNEWMNYDGIGAVPIELKKDTENPLDFTKINPKSLHKNIPAAFSFAVGNACKKMGRVFGSHLNNSGDEYLSVQNLYT